jgi:hypothetical protein
MQFKQFKIKPVNGRGGNVYNTLLLFNQITQTGENERTTSVGYVLFDSAIIPQGVQLSVNDLNGEKNAVIFKNLADDQLGYASVQALAIEKLNVELEAE